MSNLIPKQVNFNDDELLAVQDKSVGKIYVAVNCICNALGIDPENQRIKLRDHMTISKGTMILGVPSKGGTQSTFVIDLDFLPLWLSGINPAKVNPEIQDKLVSYQLKAKDVLAAAFLGQQMNLPANFAEALRLAADTWEEKEKEKQARIEAENKIKELTPAAEFGNAVGNCQDAILIRDYVKVLANDGIKMKQSELFTWLLNKYIYKDRCTGDYLPYKEYVKQGLFKVKETPFSTNTSGDRLSYTTKLTGKGQKYFYEKLKESKYAQN
jgi:phage antirepressor YoqD-like protein